MKKALLIFALISAFSAFIISMLLLHAKPEPPADPMPTRDKLVRSHSPTLGNPAAPVVIVEFLDPACETCRDFYPLVKAIMAEHAGKVSLVVRYAPFHRGADVVVAMLEGARRQDKFWPALDALFAAHGDWVVNHRADPDRAWNILSALGLDMDRMRADMASPDTAAIIRQDMADASALQVAKTPEFFVNGRPLPAFGLEPLKKLVREELQKAGAAR